MKIDICSGPENKYVFSIEINTYLKPHYKEIRNRLFDYQHEKCYWCQGQMINDSREGMFRNISNVCTLDHFYDRWNFELRKKYYNFVVACNKCNNERSREKDKEYASKAKTLGIDLQHIPVKIGMRIIKNYEKTRAKKLS